MLLRLPLTGEWARELVVQIDTLERLLLHRLLLECWPLHFKLGGVYAVFLYHGSHGSQQLTLPKLVNVFATVGTGGDPSMISKSLYMMVKKLFNDFNETLTFNFPTFYY